MGRIIPTIATAIFLAIATSTASSGQTTSGISMQHLSPQQRHDLDCMAKTIYHEARGSTEENQLAVALVVMNRQQVTKMTVCQVVHAPGQFLWTTNRPGPPAERAAWVHSQRLAYLVMFTEGVEDITAGSTHFHERTVRPDWSRRASKSLTIGAHVFHRIPQYEELAQSRE